MCVCGIALLLFHFDVLVKALSLTENCGHLGIKKEGKYNIPSLTESNLVSRFFPHSPQTDRWTKVTKAFKTKCTKDLERVGISKRTSKQQSCI